MGSTMRVLFRADASSQIGTGHVVRCLTLAEKLRGCDAEVHFVCRALEGHLCDLVTARGFTVHRLAGASGNADRAAHCNGPDSDIAWELDAELTISLIKDLDHFDWICVDHYALDHRWETCLRPYCDRLMVIDDLANRLHDCNLLLDQNAVAGMEERYVALVPAGCTSLLGPSHALLNAQYAELRLRAAPREGRPRRLLVSFGGFDQHGLTEMTVRVLCELDLAALEADIVLASSSPQYARIQDMIADRPLLRLHDRAPGLGTFILTADVSLGAGGTTHWERLALGLPSLVITVAENQRAVAAELASQGLIRWLGDAEHIVPAVLREELAGLLTADLDPQWSMRCLAVVDGRGADRVAAAMLAGPQMLLVRRHAALSDEALLLEWANDPQTRNNAFNPKPIAPDEHRSWFRTRLRRPDDCVMWVFESTVGIPVGQVRFDRRESCFEISYSVASAFRGRGVGAIMLGAAVEAFREARPGVPLIGQVKPDNPASRRIFEQLGFSVRDGGSDRLVFELGI